MSVPEFRIRIVDDLTTVDAVAWSKLAGAGRDGVGTPYNPFLSHPFLSALETSKSAVAETGWLPQHLLLEDGAGELYAALPCYLKNHSQGEYVFDHAWADAWHRAGGRYYPKLQCSVPFTPATGPRMLVRDDVDATSARAALAEGLKTLADERNVSSAHVTFAKETDISALTAAGYLHRTDQQFHFTNDGYSQYQDFLDTLSSRKRKNLKKEREAALGNGISVDYLRGADITAEAVDRFYEFYLDTGARKWGRPYLTRSFFETICDTMAEDIVLIMAKREDRYIAGAINFIGGDTLFGRHWGCLEHHRFLHFEVCYHQAIDFAIAHGLKTVEAGAQGEHKLARGYLPVTTHSAHWIPHEGFRSAITDYLDHEREEVARFGEVLKGHAPFRKSA
ncbi:MAG: GNAT family N-acetyltransferase [Pseudomonadota bacterium]